MDITTKTQFPSNKSKHSCYKCNRVYTHFVKLKVHQALVHYQRKSTAVCRKCSHPFTEIILLIRHACNPQTALKFVNSQQKQLTAVKTKASKATNRFICEFCSNHYSKRSLLELHLISHSSIKNFECIDCGTRFKHKSSLRCHRQNAQANSGVCKVRKLGYRKKSPVLTCGLCNKKFDKQCTMVRHQNYYCAADKICEICGQKGFISKRFFLRHMFEEHDPNFSSEDTKFYCSKCYGIFGSSEQLVKHRVKCLYKEEGIFNCDKCGVLKTTAERLRSHIRNFHGPKAPCQYCGKIFKTKSLDSHVRSHTGEKPYQCDRCNTHFRSKESLAKHRRKKICVGRSKLKYTYV